MQINAISLVIYAVLVILSVYNLRLAWRLSKLQVTLNLRLPDDVLPEESKKLEEINKDKKRWNALGRILFIISLVVAFFGSVEELAFFLSLYSICNIVVLRENIMALNILAVK